MKCLTDAQIQEVVDNEATDGMRQHASTCAGCADRVRAREKRTAAVIESIAVPLMVPPRVSQRIEQTLTQAATRGATHLRSAPSPGPWRRMAWSAAAVTVVTVIAVFVGPMFTGPGTVSASEILARSATRLAQRVATGVEILQYELTLDGVPREMMPDHADGAYLVKQVIDHDQPGRYFVATYDSSGQLLSSVAQDPALGRRVMTIRLNNQPYRFEFALPAQAGPSPHEIERLHMQATVAMMQASGNQHLQIIESADGQHYRIEVPRVSAQTTGAVWDLAEAQVVIDADDYNIVEFAVKGSFLKQPYSVSYRLITRTVTKHAESSEFDAPLEQDAIRMHGEGASAVPARDALMLALREIARLKQGR